MYYCHKCHHEVEITTRVMRQDTCEYCGADLRVCLNCKFHDMGMPNECKEPNSAFIADRARGNFCTYFQFAEGKDHLTAKLNKDALKQQFDKLFKK